MSDRIQADRLAARGARREQPGRGADERKARSLARPEITAHGVVLPALKMDLAVVLLVLGVLALAVSLAGLPAWIEVVCLFSGSVVVCGWLVLRARAVLRRVERREGERDGAE